VVRLAYASAVTVAASSVKTSHEMSCVMSMPLMKPTAWRPVASSTAARTVSRWCTRTPIGCRFARRPIYVQRQELEDARTEEDYTIREWVDAPGVRYEPVDGEFELLPGLRLVPARATRAACRWSSSRRAGVRSWSAGT
jgi:hypothetical protein